MALLISMGSSQPQAVINKKPYFRKLGMFLNRNLGV